MDRIFLGLAGVSGFLGIALGAFGAHALKNRLDGDMLAVFETAVQYHLVHALALGLTALASSRWPGAATQVAGWAFVAGLVLFSGSLYALALSGVRVLGAITPLGGLSFMVGWGALIWAAWR